MTAPSSPEVPAPRRADAGTAAAAAVRHPALPRAAAFTAWCWPAVFAGAPYVPWLIVWAALGHPPRLYIDVPGSAGLVAEIPSVVAAFVMVTFPAALVAGIAAIVWHDRARGAPVLATVARATLYILVWLAAIALMRADPLGVGDWFWD